MVVFSMLVLQSYNESLGYETLTKIYSTALFISMIENEDQQAMTKRDIRRISNILNSQGKVSYIINDRDVTLYDGNSKNLQETIGN